MIANLSLIMPWLNGISVVNRYKKGQLTTEKLHMYTKALKSFKKPTTRFSSKIKKYQNHYTSLEGPMIEVFPQPSSYQIMTETNITNN